MKTEILRLLKETEGYLSGQELCERFQVSRTSVWKVIEQLKKEGYEIEAVRNKGYRLLQSPDVLSEAEIQSLAETAWAGKRIVFYEETDSTNVRAKAAGEEGAPHGTLFIAEQQNAGKGRRGRSWDSPPGESVYMTILLRPQIPPSKAPMLTLLMAVSAAVGIERATGIRAQIKWPNDLVLNGKKICGILTEMSAQVDYINYVVIGTGINVNQTSFPEEIQQTATSLGRETKTVIRRAELTARILEAFEKYYAIFLETMDLSGLKEQYDSLLVNRDRDVRVLDPAGTYEAHAIGIDREGELVVVTPQGEEKKIFAGEVSVRGVYGYV